MPWLEDKNHKFSLAFCVSPQFICRIGVKSCVAQGMGGRLNLYISLFDIKE